MERAIDEVSAQLEMLERGSAALAVEDDFAARTEALDALELEVVERIELISGTGGETETLGALRARAHALRATLEAGNWRLFEKLRALIRSGECRGEELERRLRAYAGYRPGGGHTEEAGYDVLDVLVGGLLLASPAPLETRAADPDRVYYQPTPARVVLDLVARLRPSTRDVFYDLGSGLGQVVILVHLLTGLPARGIEYEPGYCAYARRCAADLDLPGVAFVNADAREADLSEGTIFYMYTPFRGEMLASVFHRLRDLSHARPIRLLTYGPCTLDALSQGWLTPEDEAVPDTEHLAVFRPVLQTN